MTRALVSGLFMVLASGCLLRPKRFGATLHRSRFEADSRSALVPDEPIVRTRARSPWADAPAPLAAPRWTPPAIRSVTLSNQMTLYIVRDPTARDVSMQYVNRRAGEDDVTLDPGLAQCTLQLLGRGTRTHPGTTLSQAYLRASTGLHLTQRSDDAELAVTTTPAEFATVAVLLAETVSEPAFDQSEFLTVQQGQRRRRQEQLERSDRATEIFSFELLFGTRHRVGMPFAGHEETISRRTVDQVRAYHASHYLPSHSAVIVVSAIPDATVQATIEQSFGRWRTTVPTLPLAAAGPELASTPEVLHFVSYPGSPLSVVTVCFKIEGIQAQRSIMPRMVSMALGELRTSRIAATLREETGLSYSPASSLNQVRQGGTITVSLAVRPDAVIDALTRTLREISRLRDTPLQDEELARVKAVMTSNTIRWFERTDTLAEWVATLYIYDQPDDQLARLLTTIDAVTNENVCGHARRYLDPAHMVVIVAGDAAESNAVALAQFNLGAVHYYQPQR